MSSDNSERDFYEAVRQYNNTIDAMLKSIKRDLPTPGGAVVTSDKEEWATLDAADELAALREQVAELTREREQLRQLFLEIQMTRVMSSSMKAWESCLQFADKGLSGEIALPDSDKLASVRQSVESINMDNLSPIEALTKLYELRRLLQS